MTKHRFDEIAINSIEKIKAENINITKYIGLEHLDSGSLKVSRWGSKVSIAGDKLFMREGDVLLGKRNAYLRRAAVAPHDGAFSAHGMVLRPREDVVDRNFFPLFISSDYFFDAAIKISVGSLSPTINWSDLRKLEFNLPDLETQRKLAELLWSMVDAKEAYRELLRQTDDLIKARFVEMLKTVKETLLLGECASLHARVGWQALKKEEYQQTGDHMLITGTDFKNGFVDYTSCVYVSKERYELDPNIQVKNGDILVTKDGTIGKVAMVAGLKIPATLNAGIFVIRPDERFDTDYFAYLFKGPIFENFIESSKTGATIKHLNQRKLLKYVIPSVSMEEQIKFSQLYNQAEKSKSALTQALTDLDRLYKRILKQELGA